MRFAGRIIRGIECPVFSLNGCKNARRSPWEARKRALHLAPHEFQIDAGNPSHIHFFLCGLMRTWETQPRPISNDIAPRHFQELLQVFRDHSNVFLSHGVFSAWQGLAGLVLLGMFITPLNTCN